MTEPDDTLQSETPEQDGEGASAAKSDGDRDEAIIVRENWERYRYGISRGHRNYTHLARRLDGFYLGGDRDGDGRLIGGGQWSEEDLAILEEQGRPAYEFNEIKPAVDSAIGYQIHNRMDIAFRPRGGDATKELADVRSKVAMQIADNNDLHWTETEVFADGLVQQRGYFDIRMNFEDSIFGELSMSTLDPMDVIPDPDAKSYNPKDWNDVIITRWLTMDEIEGLFGIQARKKAEKARADRCSERDFGDDSDDGAERSHFGDATRGWYYDAEYSNSGVRRMRVIERQRWVRQLMDVAIYPGGDVRPLSGDEAPEVLEHIKAESAAITRRRMKRVRWTVSTPDVMLHNAWGPYDRLTVVPFFPYFRRGRTRGMVDNAISPQEALNKGMSQFIHVVNTSANSGWQVEENQLTNMTAEQLEESGARTGLVIERKAGSAPLQKIKPNEVPQGVDRIIDRAARTLKEVTVPDAMRGTQGPETSGIAIQSKQHAAQQSLAVPLDGLARTRAMVGAWIDYAISKYYTTERVFQITKTDPLTGRENVEEMTINQFNSTTGQYLNDMTAGEYDVVISEQPMQVTFENSQFQQALEMRREGVRIPDPVMIRHSNLADKHEVISQMESASQSPPDPLAEAEAVLRRARAERERALARKADADTMAKGIEGMYSATQAAATITQHPGVAPLADDLLKSAGFVDRDAAPIVPSPGAMAAMTGEPIDAPQQNTSPMFPPRANPEQPEGGALVPNTDPLKPAPSSDGATAGIETQEFDE